MEPLIAQLRALPAKLAALPGRTRSLVLLGGAGVLAVALGVAALSGVSDRYEYAFTGLTADDSAAAVGQLRGAGIPFKVEAGGEALSVPSDRVYDARILLASVGIPKSGGVGFELFDRGEIGVSEFTQRVNLQRAIEGELSRTIASLNAVRSARVHVTMPRRGLFIEDDQPSTASVMLGMEQARVLSERELAGIRHLVTSAVPGLALDKVTIVDQTGALLGGQNQSATQAQLKMERELEARIVSILEPMAGPDAVVAKVTASLDTKVVETQKQEVDPGATAVKSERLRDQKRTSRGGIRGAVAGAAANQVRQPANDGSTAANEDQSSNNEQDREFDVSRTVTHEKTQEPRLQKLSIAVLIRESADKPIPKEGLDVMSELAKKAVGYDEDRGDQIQLSAAPFLLPALETGAEAEAKKPDELPLAAWALIGTGVLAVVGAGLFATRSRKTRLLLEAQQQAELEAAEARAALEALEAPAESEEDEGQELAVSIDEEDQLRERARQLVMADPQRARLLLKAWLGTDNMRREISVGDKNV